MQHNDAFNPEPDATEVEKAPEESPVEAVDPRGKRAYRRRLRSLSNVRTGLADIIRGLEGDELDANKARCLVYAYSELSGVIAKDHAQTEVEERLAKLEAALQAKPHPLRAA